MGGSQKLQLVEKPVRYRLQYLEDTKCTLPDDLLVQWKQNIQRKEN